MLQVACFLSEDLVGVYDCEGRTSVEFGRRRMLRSTVVKTWRKLFELGNEECIAIEHFLLPILQKIREKLEAAASFDATTDPIDQAWKVHLFHGRPTVILYRTRFAIWINVSWISIFVRFMTDLLRELC
jgi:hypothetical protein